MKKALGPLILAGLLIATPVLSQANTGKITGRVTAEDGTGLPGVLVTATSPALQGERQPDSPQRPAVGLVRGDRRDHRHQ